MKIKLSLTMEGKHGTVMITAEGEKPKDIAYLAGKNAQSYEQQDINYVTSNLLDQVYMLAKSAKTEEE